METVAVANNFMSILLYTQWTLCTKWWEKGRWEKGLTSVTYTHQPTWTAMDWWWRGKTCTLRYVCTEIETVQCNMNLVKHEVAAFILYSHCTFLHSPHPDRDSNQTLPVLILNWHPSTLLLSKLTMDLDLDCILTKMMMTKNGRWRPRLTKPSGMHLGSGIFIGSIHHHSLNTLHQEESSVDACDLLC